MAPVIEEFRVSAAAERHMIEEHGVEVEEALEAAESTDRHYRTYAGRPADRRYVLAGKTSGGRRLWVAFDDEGNGRGRIVTAREALGRNDVARHKRLKGD